MPTPPPSDLTPELRDRGRETRRKQRRILAALKAHEITLTELLELDVTDADAAAGIYVYAVAVAASGLRPHIARNAVYNLGIDPKRRLRKLGPAQRRRLVNRFGR